MYYFPNCFNVSQANNLNSRNKANIKERMAFVIPKDITSSFSLCYFKLISIQPQKYVEQLCCFETRIQHSLQAHFWIRGSSILSLLQPPAKAEFHLELALGRPCIGYCLGPHHSPHILTMCSLSCEKWIITPHFSVMLMDVVVTS